MQFKDLLPHPLEPWQPHQTRHDSLDGSSLRVVRIASWISPCHSCTRSRVIRQDQVGFAFKLGN
ncbi:hypothetical protein [Gluconobacter albidus]|uniref:hypothetical protein n=1 Tax=Gluconobacter albidus TaxID=318683 RepID=UPI001B8B8779|nr:hypothetical protein [Gluconobacter albidus]MBS1029760.1 hypothetical protein [Gluconobacter albidus]